MFYIHFVFHEHLHFLQCYKNFYCLSMQWSNKTAVRVCNKLYLDRGYLAFTLLAINLREN